MNRISERISAAITGVRCPGCGKFVTPTFSAGDGSPDQTPMEGGKRWSFVWRPPSGKVCPECSFPLARFARRLKWMWTFRVGVVLLVAAFALLLVRRYGGPGVGLVWPLRILAGGGLAAVVVGVVGLIVGGRHGAEPGSPPR
jgi:hypothetical protein